MAWTLSTIRARFRTLVGKPSTAQVSDADINTAINSYYQNLFPYEVRPPELRGWYEFNTVDGTGTQSIPATVAAVEAPCYIDDEEASIYTDTDQFFTDFPWTYTTEDVPDSVLVFDRTLYLRPIPDAVYAVKIRKYSVPTAFSVDADAPLNDAWGPIIAYGAAIEHLIDSGDTETADSLAASYGKYKSVINRIIIAQYPIGMRAKPRF